MRRPLNHFLIVLFVGIAAPACLAQGTKLRPYTVKDDIRTAFFGDPYDGDLDPITVSPDGRLAVVATERGLLDNDRVEDELRIYNLSAIQRFVGGSAANPPEPIMVIRESTYPEGPLVWNIRWLRDSSGVAFLLKNESGRAQLCLAGLKGRTLSILTPSSQDVTAFDITDVRHFVYAVRTIKPPAPDPFRFDGPASTVFSGKTVETILDVHDPSAPDDQVRSELWAAHGGAPFQVHESTTHQAIPVYTSGETDLSLSPNGDLVVTALPLAVVPKDWPDRFPPRADRQQTRLRAGRQDLTSFSDGAVERYELIDLRTQHVSVLVDAPAGFMIGYAFRSRIAWSQDGNKLLLPPTFLANQSGGAPCVALANRSAGSVECVADVPDPLVEYVWALQLDPKNSDHAVVECSGATGHTVRSFLRNADGHWVKEAEHSAVVSGPVQLSIRQGLNDPPVLVANDPSSGRSRVVWDPNSFLSEVDLPKASILEWTDASGKSWSGGLFKPTDFEPGRRYPLLVQTHGFATNQYRAGGLFPTAYAARELAAGGVVVLQVPDCPSVYSAVPDEAPCHLRMYEAAIKKLVADGSVDPDRVGILGFSRTCYYVLQAITTEGMHLRAAAMADGVDMSYSTYLMAVGLYGGLALRDSEGAIGAAPVGPGLQEWFQHSPAFNLDKVTTPLQLTARGRFGMLGYWEPYAILTVLKKPVELVDINATQHSITRPKARLASQGGTVDWFRFWLQGYEDPDLGKGQQYARWRKLRELHEADLKAMQEKQERSDSVAVKH